VKWWWIFAGGGLGAMCRYALAGFVQTRAGAVFPWGTFAVNALGCFVIGILATVLEERTLVGPTGRIFLLVGVLGGFTTFSTFGLETWRLIESSDWHLAAGNAFGSLGVGLAAVFLGVVVGRWVA
jgi:fluoride exporter